MGSVRTPGLERERESRLAWAFRKSKQLHTGKRHMWAEDEGSETKIQGGVGGERERTQELACIRIGRSIGVAATGCPPKVAWYSPGGPGDDG